MLDVVKAVRNNPFGEWNVVFYDPAKTNPDALFKRLRDQRCRSVSAEAPLVAEKAGVRVTVANPLSVAGDFFQITVRLPEGKKGQVEVLPLKGWTAPEGAEQTLKNTVSRVDVQTPATVKPGKYPLTLKIKVSEAAAEEFKLEVELVSRVK